MNEKLQEFISKLADLMEDYDASICGYEEIMSGNRHFEIIINSTSSYNLNNIHQMEADALCHESLSNLIK